MAALIGVATPQPFEFRGQRFTFRTAREVSNDLDWYESIIREQVKPEVLTIKRLETPEDTRSLLLLQTLRGMLRAMKSDGLFILVLCGHGFQAPDNNADESGAYSGDEYDEVFAASDGPIVDDDFADLWRTTPEIDIVIFADTCGADTLGILGARIIEPILSYDEPKPRRLAISASMTWEKAWSVPTRHGERGVMSLALEDSWTEGKQSSYLEWFQAAVEFMAVRRPQQHPRMRYLGPDGALPTRRPFT